MSLWMVRAGKYGEQEDIALREGVATVGYDKLADLSEIRSKDELENLYLKAYPDENKNQVANQVGQLWTFVSKI